MKRNTFLVFSTFLIMTLYFSTVQAQINPNPIPNTEDKIIIQVSIDIVPQGLLAYTVNVVQFPNTLTTNDPIPIEVHYENKSFSDFYLHVDHLGFVVDNENQVSGATRPIPIPADDDDENPNTNGIIEDVLPQKTSRYLFGLGDHKLTFRLLQTKEDEPGYLAQDQANFSIHFSSDTYFQTQGNNTLAYPNPFVDEITFDLTEIESPFKNKIVTITLYDQKGMVQDNVKKNLLPNSKIIYPTNTLPKGRYYYTITSGKNKRIDAGILIKQ